MARTNKTITNLSSVWDKLDNACGELDNAFHLLGSMKNLPKDTLTAMEQVDLSSIVALKNEIEILMDSKK